MGKRGAALRAINPARPTPTSDTLLPDQRWSFDAAVAACYPDMLTRSIPHYAAMREIVTTLAARFVRPGTAIVDLGCSLGGAMRPLLDRFAGQVAFVGVDKSRPMLEEARTYLAPYLATGAVELREMDLTTAYPSVTASVTLAILTLQFIPIELRQQLLREMYTHTAPGGALIVVEKILGGNADLDDLLVDAYYGMKSESGYSAEQIAAKRRALEGVLVPLTATANEELLRGAGFAAVECCWRSLNFAGWIATRPAEAPISMTHAIRGATVVAHNTPDAIHDATRDLLRAILERNELDPADIVSAFFTVTPDLNAAFPAKAARQLGWQHVALICATEIPVPGALASCMRVLLHINTTRPRSTFRSVYLRGAEGLLQDDCEPPMKG